MVIRSMSGFLKDFGGIFLIGLSTKINSFREFKPPRRSAILKIRLLLNLVNSKTDKFQMMPVR
ncbi:MAG: hypothetical protein ACJA1N_001499 [Saprospiraceae bacterium]|jgi:hypothetical protein